MDKKLLDALNNLSVALQQIADSLDPKKKKTSSIGNALSTNNIDKKLKSIDAGIKQLQNDNKQIIKNQEKILSGQQTLLSLSRRQSNPVSPVDKVTDPKQEKGIKGGLGTILMIAAGILAIGLAFKIIGNVNIMSVLAIALALPLIAMAFEEIAKMKDLKPEQMKNLVKVSVAMATAITLSSWILALTIPISINQLLTGVAIAYMFKLASENLAPIIEATKGIPIKDIGRLALVMSAVSLAIATSSWVLNLILPITTSQALTGILIAGMFAVVSHGLGPMLESVKKFQFKDIGKLALVMGAISLAIASSSWVLQLVMPLSIGKIITSILIAGMFTVVSYGLKNILEGIDGISTKQIIAFKGDNLAKIMGAVSLAIAVSSWALQLVMPVGVFQILTAIGIAAMFTVVSYGIKPLMEGIKGVTAKQIITAGAVLVGITLAIVGVAALLAYTFPKDLTLRTVLLFATTGIAIAGSMVLMAVAFVLINKIGNTSDYIKGGISLVVIATTVAIVAGILAIAGALGAYKEGNYPSFKWSLSVGLSLLIFGSSALALGVLMNATGGLGYEWLVLGGVAMALVALTVVAIGGILSKGGDIYKEGNYPSIGWSMGVGLALYPLAFSAILIGALVLTGVGAVALGVGLLTMYGIAKTVVKIAKLFNGVNWGKYPDVKWAKGVGTSLSAFGKIMGDVGLKGIILNKIGAIFGTGPEDLADQMIKVDKKFAEAGDTAFTKYPNQDWANNVGSVLLKFAELQTSGGFGGFVAGLSGNLKRIAKSIVDVDKELAEGRYEIYPKSDWVSNVTTLLKSFSDINDKIGITNSVDNMKKISTGYSELSKGLSKLGGELNKIDTDKLQALKNLTGSIVLMSLMDSDQFEKMMSALEDKAKIFVGVMNDLDAGESSNNLKTGTSAVKTPTAATEKQATITDLYNIMSSVDRRLSSIAKSNDNVSKYVDEIRTSGTILKTDKKK